MHTLPQGNPESTTPLLSNEHRQMLEVESGIPSEVWRARRYWTVTSRSQLVGTFPKWQRRAPALYVPMYSPDGETVSAQIRPKRPRKSGGKEIKYETPGGAGLILDVHPSMLSRIRDAREDLWITEGVKKADAATSRGLCTIALAGVDGWVSKGRIPLPCWSHVALEGRRVFVCFDSDVTVKHEVQGALGRLTAFLEGRGATVRVIHLPHAEDGKTGLDDYLVGGGSIAELEMAARAFDRESLTRERLDRDPDLSAALAERRAYLREMPVKTTGENTRAAVVRVLTLEAERSGELVEDGVRLEMDRRTLAERAAKSTKAVNKAIRYLEDEEGTLRRDNNGRRVEKAGAFVLLTAVAQKGTQYGGREAPGEEVSQEGEGFSELSNTPSYRGEYPSALSHEVPALRWSRVILYWARKDGRLVVADHDYIPRLGEKRGAIIRYVLEAGGSADVREDLMERFASPRTRPWDFQRRVIGPIVEAGILTLESGTVALTPDWREALEWARADAGELEDAERQREKHTEQRRKYRENYPRRHEHPADEEPTLMGAERVEETIERQRPRWEAESIEDEREKVGTTAAVFLADEMASARGIRWHELSERWVDQGGKREMLRQAVFSGPYRFHREEVDDCLYVYHAPAAEPRSAPVALPTSKTDKRADTTTTDNPIRVRGRPMPYKIHEGIYVHPPDCGCEWCDEDSSTTPVLKVVSEETAS